MSSPTVTSVSRLLQGRVPVGSPVTVRGWVRSRRDSKAGPSGLSFLHLHDGSAFEPIQVVAPGDLPNYASEVAKLGAGCAISVEGTLVASQGKGQAVEIAALNAYTETTSPNLFVGMCRSRSRSAPRGEMIMKSRMIVKFRNARIATTVFWYDVKAGGAPGVVGAGVDGIAASAADGSVLMRRPQG